MSENQNEFKGWARVEVMGHQSHIGYVTTETYGQAVMFRVDHPFIGGCEETLARPEWVGDVCAAAGSIVKRGDIEAASVLVGSGSIYRIIPCDEAAAMKAIRSSTRPPLMVVKLAGVAQLEAPGYEADELDYDDDSDKDRF